MFQGLSQADDAVHVKMEVDDEEPSSDLASREACFCLFTKFAKEVIECFISQHSNNSSSFRVVTAQLRLCYHKPGETGEVRPAAIQ